MKLIYIRNERLSLIKMLVMLVLIITMTDLFGCGLRGNGKPGSENVALGTISTGTIESSITVNGVLESQNIVDILFPANYKIIDIFVKKYQKIEEGDVLAEIIPNTVAAAVDSSIVEEVVKSPISGYISEVYTRKNAITTASQPVFQIIDVSDLYIRSTVRQGDLKFIKTGQKVIVKADAFSDIELMDGVLDLIVPFARKSTSVSAEDVIIDIGISFVNSSTKLKPGYTVSCNIMTARADNVLLLPLEGLMEDKNKGKYVFIYNREQGKIFVQYIKLGVVSDFFAEIKSGLNEGDEVVLNPKPAFKDGMKVKVK